MFLCTYNEHHFRHFFEKTVSSKLVALLLIGIIDIIGSVISRNLIVI